MDLATFTVVHTAISLLGLVAGIPVVRGLLVSRISMPWTNVFLVLAIAASATGFFFPFKGLTPAIIVGVIALLVFGFVLLARYQFRFAAIWRMVYSGGMVASLFFLVFVTIAQAFSKISFLHALAPTGSEPAFAIAELIFLVAFGILGWNAVRKFKPVMNSKPM